MKRALVLSGGGSRGAYEIGAWQALCDMGVRFQGVYGTSIGALNAVLVARGDLERARALWQNISIANIATVEDPETFAIDRMVNRKRDVIPFLMENAKHLRMDIAPLEKMIRAECDEARIRANGMELGVMTFRVPQMQGVPARLANMKPGALADWVIASASCFPLFPARQIDGQRYIDGGYYDNLPIDMALADGADEIIAVDIHPYHTHPEYARMPWLKTIMPKHNLGGFLDFNPLLLRRSLRLGYQDAMKAYNRLDGCLYTFQHVNPQRVSDTARRFLKRAAAFDAECMRRGALYAGQPVNAPMLMAIECECVGQPLDWKTAWVRGLELCAEVMGYRVDAIYDADHLLHQIATFCAAQPHPENLDETTLHAAWKGGPRPTLAALYHCLLKNGDYPMTLMRRLSELPHTSTAALFLHTATASLL